jgi:hypothetical protein
MLDEYNTPKKLWAEAINTACYASNRLFLQKFLGKTLYELLESRMTPIQEGEDDEDITTLDIPTLWSFSSCNSSPTQLPRHPRIQQTHRHCFGHNSLIRHRNGAFLDALERGRRRHRFGSSPSSRRSVDHSV